MSCVRRFPTRRGEITVLPVGPLTNVARALAARPGFAQDVANIVIMGGSIGIGNVTPHAEFNFHVDPHAAHIVFESGAPIVMHGLNVTHQVRAKPDGIAALRAFDTTVGHATAGMLTFYGSDTAPAHCATCLLLAICSGQSFFWRGAARGYHH